VTEPTGHAASAERSEEQLTESVDGGAGGAGPRAPKHAPRLAGLSALACYALLPLSGVFGWAIAALVALVISQGMDLLIVANQDLRTALARGQFGISTRTMVRELSIVALVLSASWATRDAVRGSVVLLLLVIGMRLLYQLVLVLVRRRAVLPVETLNIDLSGIRRPPVLPELMQRRLSERYHGLSAIALIGAAIAVVSQTPAVLFVIVGAVVAVELVAVAAAVSWLVRSRGASIRESYLTAVHKRVAALRSEVMLYHSGAEDSIYQVDMWLSVVEQIGRPAIVALRERACFAALAPTSLPVICIPGAVEFMSFSLPDVRVALYTANVGKTIHMLREPGVRHVFVGHGDSDKTASFNPFSKVYSEIWVAGEGGRDRYRRAAVGIRDDEIVEVGRPQLGSIRVVTDRIGDRVLTVLYAPTWEGWTADPAHTSLMRTGPALVERLVGFANVRVIYKPHPFTGTVSAEAEAADAAIRSIIARAGGSHLTVVGPSPTLYECFNDADLLIADISSVLTDFIYSEKPYVVANLSGMSEAAFRKKFPSVGMAYLLDPAAERIGAILDLVRDSDPLAPERHELKRYLLGPDEPDAMTRFAAAVDAAYTRAVSIAPTRVAAGRE
jgi:hypothetical protein